MSLCKPVLLNSYLISTFDNTYPQFDLNYGLESLAVFLLWLCRLHTSLLSFGVHGQVKMLLWSWLVPTCCWTARSCRKFFQPSVTQKWWCASWRSVPRHHCRHYAWLRRTEVSECLSTVCDSVFICRSSWSRKVFSFYKNEIEMFKNDNNCLCNIGQVVHLHSRNCLFSPAVVTLVFKGSTSPFVLLSKNKDIYSHIQWRSYRTLVDDEWSHLKYTAFMFFIF